MQEDWRPTVQIHCLNHEAFNKVICTKMDQSLKSHTKYFPEIYDRFCEKISEYGEHPRSDQYNAKIEKATENVEKLHHLAVRQEPFFAADMVCCGSVADGVDIESSDVDFMMTLSGSSEWLKNATVDSKTTLNTRPTKSVFYCTESDIRGKSYFTLYFNGLVPDELLPFVRCEHCLTPGDCSGNHSQRFLCPRTIQDCLAKMYFLNRTHVQSSKGTTLSQICNTDIEHRQLLSTTDQEDCIHISKHGPAVKIQGMFFGQIWTADVTVALKMNRQSRCWPFDGRFQGLTLRGDTEDLECCHLVPAGDFWQLCFAGYERTVMEKIPTQSKTVLRALKVIANKASVESDGPQADRSTYHLKCGIMKTAAGTSLHSCTPDIIGETLLYISNEGEYFRNPHLENEAAFPDDRKLGHIEVFRIQKHLHDILKDLMMSLRSETNGHILLVVSLIICMGVTGFVSPSINDPKWIHCLQYTGFSLSGILASICRNSKMYYLFSGTCRDIYDAMYILLHYSLATFIMQMNSLFMAIHPGLDIEDISGIMELKDRIMELLDGLNLYDFNVSIEIAFLVSVWIRLVWVLMSNIAYKRLRKNMDTVSAIFFERYDSVLYIATVLFIHYTYVNNSVYHFMIFIFQVSWIIKLQLVIVKFLIWMNREVQSNMFVCAAIVYPMLTQIVLIQTLQTDNLVTVTVCPMLYFSPLAIVMSCCIVLRLGERV